MLYFVLYSVLLVVAGAYLNAKFSTKARDLVARLEAAVQRAEAAVKKVL
jgi:hypothetical protein